MRIEGPNDNFKDLKYMTLDGNKGGYDGYYVHEMDQGKVDMYFRIDFKVDGTKLILYTDCDDQD